MTYSVQFHNCCKNPRDKWNIVICASCHCFHACFCYAFCAGISWPHILLLFFLSTPLIVASMLIIWMSILQLNEAPSHLQPNHQFMVCNILQCFNMKYYLSCSDVLDKQVITSVIILISWSNVYMMWRLGNESHIFYTGITMNREISALKTLDNQPWTAVAGDIPFWEKHIYFNLGNKEWHD